MKHISRKLNKRLLFLIFETIGTFIRNKMYIYEVIDFIIKSKRCHEPLN